MKRTNKKGFTIVELVIVIAVIAILAAVLIPTFAGIISKANLSNDKSFVKNMNTTLLAEGTVDEFETAGDAINALNRNGFTGKYETYSSGFHYVYSLEKNQMYLLNDENAVVYPEEDIDVATLWGLYTDNRTSYVPGITKYVAMTNITNSAHYNEVFKEGNYTIDLNNYYISVDSTLTGVTANNGIVLGGVNAGDGVNTGYAVIAPGTYDDVTKVSDVELGASELNAGDTIVIEDKIFTEFVHPSKNTVNYVFKNCIFYGNAGLQFFDGSGAADGVTATVEGCQFVDIAEGRWAIISNSSLTVKDTTFTKLNKRGAIQIHEDSKDMAINISGCTFDGTGGEYPLIRFVGEYTLSGGPGNIASVAIENCKFTTLNKATGIIGFSGTTNSLYNYTGTGATLTFTNNTLDKSITSNKYVVGAGEGNTIGTAFAAGVK